jgi:hypothetical protein
LNRHRRPRIAFACAGEKECSSIVITAVTGKTLAEGAHSHGLPADGDLMAWRSNDGGKTWSGIRVNDVAGAPTEGLHSLAGGPGGRLFAVWLDKRSGKTKLYGALSNDAGLTWSKNVLIYDSPEGTICECCHPSAAFDRSGRILVMFRNWLGGSRDMYLVQSEDGQRFGAPRKLGTGTWQLNACPMDGGGIAVSPQGIITAWRRERSLFLARPGDPETEIGTGADVAIASGSKGTFAIWSAADSIQALFPGDRQPRSLGAKGAFPAIAVRPSGDAIAAWEKDGGIALRILR